MNKVLVGQIKKTGRLIVISAASGTGKTTLIKVLCKSDPELVVSVSHTTRRKRPQEVEAIDYFFTDINVFKKMIDDEQFLEHATIFGNDYGTSKHWVKEQLNVGKDVILEIDWQGTERTRQLVPDCVSIFLLPPNYQTLETRLLARDQDNMETIQRRMRDAVNNFSHCHEYDFLVINDKFEQALSEVRDIIKAVREGQHIEQQDVSQLISSLIAGS